MAGRLVIDNLYGSDSTSGLTFNATTKRVNPVYGNFIFQQDAGVLTPIGKTKATFIPTGAQQTWVVPSGITNIFVKLWGAGGAGGSTGGWVNSGRGGAGGHSYGIIPVTPAETLYIVVGLAGQTCYTGAQTPRYGGGGGLQSNTNNLYAGSGGGYCGIFRTSVSQATALLIAGGGGGGAASRMFDGNWGGAGGGTTGQVGNSPYDARGSYGGNPGTQSAGGAIATGNVSVGTALTGGYGGPAVNPYGGGGGGGYWGGSGGGYIETYTMAGGGGGSGYVGSTVLMGATFTGSRHIPAMSHDPDLLKTLETFNSWNKYAYGGDPVVLTTQYTAAGGGGGYCVIYY